MILELILNIEELLIGKLVVFQERNLPVFQPIIRKSSQIKLKLKKLMLIVQINFIKTKIDD